MVERLLELDIVPFDIPIKPELVHTQVECGRLYRDIMGMISFQCGLCPLDFEYIAEFAMHLADNHPVPVNKTNGLQPLEPDDVDVVETIMPENESHMPTDTVGKKFETAEETLSNPALEAIRKKSCTATKHTKRIERSQYERCLVCYKRLSPAGLEKHIAELGPTIPPSQVKCSERSCGRVFEAKCQLLKHTYRAHSEKYKKHKCHLCEKRYKSGDALSIHIRVHEGKKPYECDICGRCFASRACIRAHMSRIHSGEKPYQCWHCGQRFNSSSFMMSHIQVHHLGGSGRTFKCDKCEKAFFTSYLLKAHYRIHTGERPYKCELCGKSYTKQNALNIHMKATHINARQFKCNHCPKTFNLKTTVRQHEKQVHERRMNLERALLCDIEPP